MLIMVYVLTVCGVLVASVLLNGWAVWLLLGWFVVPLGVAPLTVAHAIGIAILCATLTHQYDGSDNENGAKALGYMLGKPVLAVGCGWLVHQWM